ncbi:LPXTG cell wall anchor domain-containing protein [Listeria sp. FSL L7-1517]|uniref:LPXTG cell wall anchor domain-containing protein n=1 Tax=Listeria immobilis TaxID=2713502 RepID=UPI00164D0525|nr:LPXTG cell wall anchor domain-containing protein [Listeria immobilis]MBC6296256.1 LPXTG cell wall anchor domain-containing protein [Listeria immobilis]
MKKIGFILLCAFFICVLPLFTQANTNVDTAISRAGIKLTQDSGTKTGETDDRSGTFPSKKPISKLPKTGDTSEPYLLLLGLGLLILATKSHVKEVRQSK